MLRKWDRDILALQGHSQRSNRATQERSLFIQDSLNLRQPVKLLIPAPSRTQASRLRRSRTQVFHKLVKVRPERIKRHQGWCHNRIKW